MNYFSLHPHSGDVRPVAYCAADPVDSYISNRSPAGARQLLQSMVGHVEAESYVFHHSVKSLIDELDVDWMSRAYYVVPCEVFSSVSNIELDRPVAYMPDTSVLAVIVALYFGFSQIYLLGVDFDRLSTGGKQGHFYEESKELECAALAGSDAIPPRPMPYSHEVYWMHRSLSAHACLAEIAQRRSQTIVNLNPNSFLDAYPKGSFEVALAQ